ncbi:MAG: hypothetical protein H7210_00095 [Pyrinomonadaceae bacterium]|nr:hypothetical protein [Phycisphaerales bacterium]
MKRCLVASAVLAAAAATSAVGQEQPIQNGDIALGLSTNSTGTTLPQVRAGSQVGSWTSQAFAQSAEFDNCDGPFSHSGNLLALNFGTTAGGGTLLSFSSNGANFGQVIYAFNAGNGGIATTRIGGLSVSPDNTRIACLGYDTGQVYILDYTPGQCGQGMAAVTNPLVSAGLANTGDTQGTTWLDDSTVIAYSAGGPQGSILWTVPVADPNNPTFQMIVNTTGAGSQFTDVEYNPCISPYIFCSYSNFEANVTTNKLTVIDPRAGSGAWTQVAQIDLSVSLQTGREIALGRDGALYLSEFAGSTAPQPKIYVDRLNLDFNSDGVIDAIDLALLTDNSSIDYYTVSGGVSSSFNGLDVVVGRQECGTAPTGACCLTVLCVDNLTRAACEAKTGVYQGDQTVCRDVVCTIPVLCPCDWNRDLVLNSQDFFDFIAAFFGSGADYNMDGMTTSQDFFDFLGCFFAPPITCP